MRPGVSALATAVLAGAIPGAGAAGATRPALPPTTLPRLPPTTLQHLPPATLPRIDAATTLLVVSPHPDDETLCCAGVIQRVARAGGSVNVVWITSGDAERMELLLVERVLLRTPQRALRFAARRMAEARAAASLLGVPASGQLFLGYPDGGVLSLLDDKGSTPHTSRATDASAVPYPDALFPGHPYTRQSLVADFTAVLDRVHPSLVLAPSPQDEHPDHRAAGLLTIAVSRRRGLLRHVRYWIVHGGEGWPSPRGLMPGVPLTPAPRSRGLWPAPFDLEPSEEDTKLRAIQAYDTQMQVMAPFLLAFVRSTELFSSRTTADPAALEAGAP